MNDYEINKRLAEIAEVRVEPQVYDDVGRFLQIPFTHGDVWQPLNDWSQLGPLMERAAWEISYLKAREWDKRKARWEVRCWPLHDESAVHEACDASQQKAICLAIIAAHEEE